MSEVDMLRAALGIAGTVITALVSVIVKLVLRSWDRDEKMIQFAKDLLSKGDPCETFEKVAKILKETKTTEPRCEMGRDDHPASN